MKRRTLAAPTALRSLALRALLIGFVTLGALTTAGSGALGAAELPFLLELSSERVALRYTPGALDRASRVRDRFDLLLEEFSGGGYRVGLGIYLLSRDEWEAAGIEVPYGLPAVVGPQELALAAWGDAGTVALWGRLAPNGVPRLEGSPVRGTRAEAESLSALDLVAEVEAARILTPLLGIDTTVAGAEWCAPLVAQTLAWSAFLRFEPGRAAEIGRLFDAMTRAALAEGDERAGVATRLVAEAGYAEAAIRIAEIEGRPPAKPLLKWLRKRAKAKRAPALPEGLVQRYPPLADWLAGRAEIPVPVE